MREDTIGTQGVHKEFTKIDLKDQAVRKLYATFPDSTFRTYDNWTDHGFPKEVQGFIYIPRQDQYEEMEEFEYDLVHALSRMHPNTRAFFATDERLKRPQGIDQTNWTDNAEMVTCLYYGAGKSEEEIADVLKMDPTAVQPVIKAFVEANMQYTDFLGMPRDLIIDEVPLERLQEPDFATPSQLHELSERQRDSFYHETVGLNREHARQILEEVESGKTPVIYGQRGSGKTLQLGNAISEEVNKRHDLELGLFDAAGNGFGLTVSDFKERLVNFALRDTRPDTKKVLLIDEAQIIVDFTEDIVEEMGNTHPFVKEKDRLAELLRWGKEKGIGIIFINAGVTQEDREKVNSLFAEQAEKVEGAEVTFHEKQFARIPTEIAQKFLQDRGADQALLDFIATPSARALLNMRLFDNFFINGHTYTYDRLRRLLKRSTVSTLLKSTPLGGDKQAMTELVEVLIGDDRLLRQVFEQEKDKDIDWS